MNDQEIKLKALELTMQLISLFPDSKKLEQLQKGNPVQVIIELSQDFQAYLKKPN
jgi:hypothetical protein